MFFSSVPDPLTNKKAQDQHPKVQTCALQKAFECAHKAPDEESEPDGAQDPKRRDEESLYSNYTFTTLIDRFTSLRSGCAISWL